MVSIVAASNVIHIHGIMRWTLNCSSLRQLFLWFIFDNLIFYSPLLLRFVIVRTFPEEKVKDIGWKLSLVRALVGGRVVFVIASVTSAIFLCVDIFFKRQVFCFNLRANYCPLREENNNSWTAATRFLLFPLTLYNKGIEHKRITYFVYNN